MFLCSSNAATITLKEMSFLFIACLFHAKQNKKNARAAKNICALCVFFFAQRDALGIGLCVKIKI